MERKFLQSSVSYIITTTPTFPDRRDVVTVLGKLS